MGLSPSDAELVRLAAATACGDLDQVVDAWRQLTAADREVDGEACPTAEEMGFEAILQTLLFVGFPRVINALGAVHKLRGAAGEAMGFAAPAEESPAERRRRGESLCGAIYGQRFTSLRHKMQSLHPLLDTWMIEVGYGRILSRPQLSPRQRELCVVAVLCGFGASLAPQLRAHLHGGLNVGCSKTHLGAALRVAAGVWGEATVAFAEGVLEQIGSREGDSSVAVAER